MEVTQEMNDMMDKMKIGIFTSTSKFLSTVIFNLNHVWDSSVKTAKLDGKTVKYNPKFMSALDPKMRITVMAHEAWHLALGHPFRLGNKKPNTFNKAGDYVANQMLKDAGYILPVFNGNPVLQNDRYKGMSAEEVYKLICEDGDEDPEDDSLMGGDVNFNPESSEDSEEDLEVEVGKILNKAKTASEASGEDPGHIPQEIRRKIEKLLRPKLPWQTLIRKYVNQFTKNDYSWRKPNKRYFPDFILPSLYSEEIGLLAFALDTSGSQYEKQTSEAIKEIDHICKMFNPTKAILMDCDYKIHNIYEIDGNTDLYKLKFSGRGGTRFDPVIKYLNELKQKPLLLIYFTDLKAPLPRVDPLYPILWVCNSNVPASPIGKTIYIE